MFIHKVKRTVIKCMIVYDVRAQQPSQIYALYVPTYRNIKPLGAFQEANTHTQNIRKWTEKRQTLQTATKTRNKKKGLSCEAIRSAAAAAHLHACQYDAV